MLNTKKKEKEYEVEYEEERIKPLTNNFKVLLQYFYFKRSCILSYLSLITCSLNSKKIDRN